LLLNTLSQILVWTIKWVPQDNSKATYCSKIEKEDGEVDLMSDKAQEIYNKFRAYYIWPWIYTFFKWKRLVITECHLQDWKLILEKVKPEWKKEMSIKDFVNGNKEFREFM
jgi:methionyl-tRNA formyltransferase